MKSKESGAKRQEKFLIPPREVVARLDAYDPGCYRVKINLSANENPYDLPGDLKARILADAANLPFNRYPDPAALELRSAIAERHDLPVDRVAVGNGGDELLLALLLAYGGLGRRAITFEPTFVMYSILSELTGTECVRSMRRQDFRLPHNAVEEIASPSADIAFVCSPNNPSGNLVAEAELEQLLETGALVLVDEAYGEFSRASAKNLLDSYRNLAILRTFSKAFSLAGLRVGYLLADPAVIANVHKVKLPYNANVFSQAAATILMRNQELFNGVIDQILSERERVYSALSKLKGLTTYRSSANFILVRAVNSGERLWRNLLGRGILVRCFKDTPGLKDCLRITIGSPAENDALMAALGEELEDGRG